MKKQNKTSVKISLLLDLLEQNKQIQIDDFILKFENGIYYINENAIEFEVLEIFLKGFFKN